MVLSGNRAAGQAGTGVGGGLAVFQGSTATLTNSNINVNRARERGRGVYVDGGELVMLGTDNQGEPGEGGCQTDLVFNRYCSEVHSNLAARPIAVGPGEGGGVYVEGGGSVELERTSLWGNGADADAAQARVTDGGSLELDTCVLADISLLKPATVGVVVDDQGWLLAEASSFAGDGAGVSYAGSALGSFDGNVIWPAGGVGGGLTVTTALAGGDNVGLGVTALGGAANDPSDPQFVTTSLGDYRICPGSPAFDKLSHGKLLDLDQLPRPVGADDEAGAFEWPGGACP